MDPVQAATRWQQWSVRTTMDRTDRVLDALTANLPSGWRPADGSDEPTTSRPFSRKAVRWYRLDSAPGRAGVALSIDSLRSLLGTDLRGGVIWFEGATPDRPADIPGAWHHVMQLLDDGIAPAARAAGATLDLPSPADIFLSDLPGDVEQRLLTFSAITDRSLPLDDAAAEQWHKFVLAAFRSRVPVGGRAFVDWLVSTGWKSDQAVELVNRFYDQTLLLSRYTAEALAG